MAVTTILYGLGTCDTCRKARKALEAADQAVTFRDVRAEPLTPEERARFLETFGEALINCASTTWRGLDAGEREKTPEALLAAHPTLMKRPVIARGDKLWLGWKKPVQDDVLK